MITDYYHELYRQIIHTTNNRTVENTDDEEVFHFTIIESVLSTFVSD